MVADKLGNSPQFIPLGRCEICWTIFAALSLLGISFLASSTIIDRFNRAQAPVQFHSTRFLEASAAPGAAVHLEIDRTRHQVCTGLVFQWWIQDGRILQQEVLPAGSNKRLGRQIDVFSKRLPESPQLRAGQVCYQPRLMYLCDGATKLVEQPKACIDVVIN